MTTPLPDHKQESESECDITRQAADAPPSDSSPTRCYYGGCRRPAEFHCKFCPTVFFCYEHVCKVTWVRCGSAMIYLLCSKRHTNRIPGSIRPRLERARDDKGPWFDSTLPREEWDRLQCLPPECENECHLCGQPGVRDETTLADHFDRCHPREDPRRPRLSDVDSGDDDDSDDELVFSH